MKNMSKIYFCMYLQDIYYCLLFRKRKMIPESEQKIYINLLTKWQVQFGKAVYCTGQASELGGWDPHKAIRLSYMPDNIWHASVKIQSSLHKGAKEIAYKYFVSKYNSPDTNDITWQNNQDNHKISLESLQPLIFPIAPIVACSFNIRFLTDRDKGQNNWQARKDRVVEFLKNKKYDVVGVQEATLPQREYMQKGLGEIYRYYGMARDLGKDEECGIFIKKEKFVVLADQYEWISQSREAGKKGYDAKLPRYFTTLLAVPRISSLHCEKLTVWAFINLHLDHEGKEARKKGVQQVLEKCIQIRNNQNYELQGCIVMGDFNLAQGHPHLALLSNNVNMPMTSLRSIEGADRHFTFNGFQSNWLLSLGSLVVNNEMTIDHMFCWLRPGLRALQFWVERREEKYLSDHFPIIGKFGLDL